MLFNLSASDPLPAGRINPSMLTDQQLMELLYTPLDPKRSRSELGGSEDNACTWRGISCRHARVTSIFWSGMADDLQLDGVIDFAMLPPSLLTLCFSWKSLRGDIDTSALPPQLEVFQLESCAFTGTLDLGNLPRTLMVFRVTYEKVTAIVNMENLPSSLIEFVLSEQNLVSKELFVGKLPSARFAVDLTGCGALHVTLADECDRQRVRVAAP